MSNLSPEKITAECLAAIIDKGLDKIAAKIKGIAIDQYEKIKIDFDLVFRKYLKKCLKTYGKVKTILYKDEPQPLYDFFVCPNLRFYKNTISTTSIDDILSLTEDKCFLIQGSGGEGKSILLRHFLLDEVKKKDYIPVFIELKNFSSFEGQFLEFLHFSIDSINTKLKKEYFDYALDSGCFMFLLDGYDELSDAKQSGFFASLNRLANRYDKNCYIMSSRPLKDEEIVSLQKFISLQTMPFSEQQAIQLIENLKFDKKKKTEFIMQLKNRLYDSHRSFASNPLLLTIMLLTFDQYASIPEKMYLFYDEAFESLYCKHDASKEGYVRKSNSGLAKDTFRALLSEFCLISFAKHEYEFTYEGLKGSLSKAASLTRIQVDVDAFINDLCKSVCLMFIDGRKYRFYHRSFQEYFAAKCLSEKDSQIMSQAIMHFIEKDSWRTETVINMIVDMKPDRIGKEVIMPILREHEMEFQNERERFDHFLSWIAFRIYADKKNESDSNKVYLSIHPGLPSFVLDFSLVDNEFKGNDIPGIGDERLLNILLSINAKENAVHVHSMSVNELLADESVYGAFVASNFSDIFRFIMNYYKLLNQRYSESENSLYALLGIL